MEELSASQPFRDWHSAALYKHYLSVCGCKNEGPVDADWTGHDPPRLMRTKFKCEGKYKSVVLWNPVTEYPTYSWSQQTFGGGAYIDRKGKLENVRAKAEAEVNRSDQYTYFLVLIRSMDWLFSCVVMALRQGWRVDLGPLSSAIWGNLYCTLPFLSGLG